MALCIYVPFARCDFTVYCLFYVEQGTIEEKIYQRQVTKLALGDSVVDAVKESQIKFSPEDLKVCRHQSCFLTSISFGNTQFI